MTDQVELWQDNDMKVEVSVAEMDRAVQELREAKDHYADVKKVSESAYHVVRTKEENLMSLMKQAGKQKYIAEGIGRVTLTETLSVRTPKGTSDKQAFFNWVRENMGEDAYWSYMSVNSASLNSLYKTLNDEAASRGEVLRVDGLEEPTAYTKLSLRKA